MWIGAHRRPLIAVAAALGLLVVAAIAIPLASTSTPEFFSRYHLLNRRYVNLSGSAHEGIGCRVCHETQPLANGVSLVGDFYASIFKAGETPKYFRFSPPRNDACLKCHSEDWSYDAKRTKRIPHPAHARVAAETRDCVGCHKWTGHLENYLEKHEKMPFSGVCAAYGCHVGTKQSDQCFDCHHVLRETKAEWTAKHSAVVATAGQNGCLESCHTVEQCQTCHTTGKPPKVNFPPVQIVPTVERLHVKADWLTKYHGAEALKHRSSCLLCHQSEGECDECHRYRPAFHGPDPVKWIGGHSKVTTDVVDPRCIECHKEAFCEDCHEQFEEME